MRDLRRNETPIWYALLLSKTENVDEYGNATGTFTLEYSDPVKAYMNVRWNMGDVQVVQYGLSTDGRRRIVTDDMNCPITESSILWIGIEPDENGENGAVKHNYELSGVPEKSLNQIVYLVQEVNVS